MLYVIQKGFNDLAAVAAENIVYCVSSIQKILDAELEFFFTDGHAVDSFSAQYTLEDLHLINDLVDWQAVKAQSWISDTDLDLKRRKQAEFLVLGDLPFHAVLGFIVYNEAAKDRLLAKGVRAKQIHIDPRKFF